MCGAIPSYRIILQLILHNFVILSHLSIMTDYYRQICHMHIIFNSFSYHIHYNMHMNANVIAYVRNSIMNDYLSTNVNFDKIHYPLLRKKTLPSQGIYNFEWLLVGRCSVCYSKHSYQVSCFYHLVNDFCTNRLD